MRDTFCRGAFDGIRPKRPTPRLSRPRVRDSVDSRPPAARLRHPVAHANVTEDRLVNLDPERIRESPRDVLPDRLSGVLSLGLDANSVTPWNAAET